MDRLLDLLKAYDISLSQLAIVAGILLIMIIVDFVIRFTFRRYEKALHQSPTIKMLFYLSLKTDPNHYK